MLSLDLNTHARVPVCIKDDDLGRQHWLLHGGRLMACAGFLGLFRGRYARPLAIGSSLMLFQQITGQPSVLYYAADIFERAGFSAGKDATGVSVILGLWKLVMTGALAYRYLHVRI